MYFHAPCGVVLYCFVCKLYANKEKKKKKIFLVSADLAIYRRILAFFPSCIMVHKRAKTIADRHGSIGVLLTEFLRGWGVETLPAKSCNYGLESRW